MDSDSEIDSEFSPRQATRRLPERAAKAKIRAPTRMTRSTAAYFSSQSPTTDNDSDASTDGDGINSRKRRNTAGAGRTSKRTRRSLRSQTRQKTERRQNHPNRVKPRRSRAKAHTFIDKEEVVQAGDWANLPYLAWSEVFEHVAAPLRDPQARAPDISSAIRSLLSAAHASKSLSQPALTALYKSPILSLSSAHYFVRMLSLPSSSLMFNYRPMIESLRVEVDETLARKFMGQYLNLQELIQNLPRLMDVELYHRLDQAPYRNLDDTVRWRYPPELLEALKPLPNADIEATDKTTYTELRSWSWSSRLAGELCSLDKLQEIHRSSSFASLRHITFVNYQLPSITSKSRDPAEILAMDMPKIEQLAAAITALPRLEHLTLESSTMANGHLLELLPKNLKHLELVNCWDIEAESFAIFLVTHGHSLRRLTLDHCQSLSLAFLPVLSSACPELVSLHMDMSYFRHHEHYNDAEPLYDVLLSEDQTPMWPSTLQSIDIQHMRQWAGKDEDVRVEEHRARIFFESLERSASSLLALRRLVLKAMLNVPFRQRAEFRDRWVTRLTDIYQRPFVEPKRHFRRTQLVIPLRREVQKQESQTPSAAPTRRSSRIAEMSHTSLSPEEDNTDLSARERSRMSSVRREAKRLLRVRPSHIGHEADDEESEDELAASSSNEMTSREPAFRQLLCDVVDIQIDNQKPTEHQYAMDDFLDTPTESDEEWNGVDEVFD